MASAPGGASALPSIAGYEQLYHAPVRLLSEIVAPVAAAAGGATPLAPLRNGDAVATTGTVLSYDAGSDTVVLGTAFHTLAVDTALLGAFEHLPGTQVFIVGELIDARTRMLERESLGDAGGATGGAAATMGGTAGGSAEHEALGDAVMTEVNATDGYIRVGAGARAGGDARAGDGSAVDFAGSGTEADGAANDDEGTAATDWDMEIAQYILRARVAREAEGLDTHLLGRTLKLLREFEAELGASADALPVSSGAVARR